MFEGARFHGRTKVIALGHGKGSDEAPLRAGEHLQDEAACGVGISERLSVVGIEGFYKWKVGRNRAGLIPGR